MKIGKLSKIIYLCFLIFISLTYCLISKIKIQEDILCQMFPTDNIWNTPIDSLPVHPNSDNYINAVGASKPFHPDFAAALNTDVPYGIPYMIVPGTQPKVKVTFDYPDESDGSFYPIPLNPLIEGGATSTGDRHILIVDKDNLLLYELYSAYPNTDGTWRAGSSSIFNLNSDTLRPDGWTSCDAAGLPILPGLVRYDEVAKGEIKHAIRFTIPNTLNAYLWPARHKASSKTDPALMPMGLRIRLKQGYDISGFSAENQVILKAFKKYGLLLADNGSPWFFTGVGDARWNDDDLNNLKKLKGSDFEALDESSLMIDPNSGRAKQSTTESGVKYIYGIEDLNLSCSPNPFTNTLSIRYDNPVTQKVKITINDIFGNSVNTICDVTQPSGHCECKWDGNNSKGFFACSGIYFIRIETRNSLSVCPVSFIK